MWSGGIVAENPISDYLSAGGVEESSFRSIVLFGRNVASYKFALARALMDLAAEGRESATLAELAVPYTAHLVEHVRRAPKQTTGRQGRLLEACAGFASGTATRTDLIDAAVGSGFNCVLDAFHTVNQTEVPIRFFEKDFARGSKRIVLTDAAHRVCVSPDAANMAQETESRWSLVETAWECGVNANLLSCDSSTQAISVNDALRRRSVTSARGAFDGYQKGRCFYCFAPISVVPGGAAPLCDVDHFFPHALARVLPGVNLDGVWNLVLACPECNRGEGGKFARIADGAYLRRLHRRNEYLISSHHPLRESIIAQTGANAEERWSFLSKVDMVGFEALPGARWATAPRAAAEY